MRLPFPGLPTKPMPGRWAAEADEGQAHAAFAPHVRRPGGERLPFLDFCGVGERLECSMRFCPPGPRAKRRYGELDLHGDFCPRF